MIIPALQRINELARLAKSRELTATEIAERDRLRREYLAAIRGQVDAQLLASRIIDSDGNDVTPEKLRAAQAAHKKPQ